MKKFEAIGVTCKTDITASKKKLIQKYTLIQHLKSNLSKLEYRVFKLSHIISLSSGKNRGWGKI